MFLSPAWPRGGEKQAYATALSLLLYSAGLCGKWNDLCIVEGIIQTVSGGGIFGFEGMGIDIKGRAGLCMAQAIRDGADIHTFSDKQSGIGVT